MVKFLGRVELVAVISAGVLIVFWMGASDSLYEPLIALCLLIGTTAVEMVRRRLQSTGEMYATPHLQMTAERVSGASNGDPSAQPAGQPHYWRSIAQATVPPIAGTYQLQAFTLNGRRLSVRGTMRVVQIEADRFRYDADAINFENGANVFYGGFFRKYPAYWTGVTEQSNDPLLPRTAFSEAPVDVQFDGSTLVVTNDAARAVWSK